jgi:hypothetical protein
MAVTRIDAPETGRSVQNLAAIVGGVVHTQRRRHQSWPGFELAIRRKRHPQVIGIESLSHDARGLNDGVACMVLRFTPVAKRMSDGCFSDVVSHHFRIVPEIRSV